MLIIEWANGDREVYDENQVVMDYEQDDPYEFLKTDRIIRSPKMLAEVHLGGGIKKTGPVKQVTYYRFDK